MERIEKYTILTVDDSTENIDVLSGILNDDYTVKIAKNGKMALKVAEKFRPDLILLDIMMPEMNGYEVCTHLKTNPMTRRIPVIFVTAKDQTFDEVKGFELGAVDYISKPISPTIVKARVATHLSLFNQQKLLNQKVKDKTQELTETRLEVIRKLSRAAEYKDEDTGMHVVRVSKYCYHIAKAYGLDECQAELLMNAAPMHDVGKIGISDRILLKPGKLDQEEWTTMKSHTTIGKEILGDHESDLLQAAGIVALQHHEKWNGKGYPQGLSGEAIHIYGRITAVSDVFDALTSERPYKNAWEAERAFNLIRQEANEHFDPDVVEAFVQVYPEILRIKERYS